MQSQSQGAELALVKVGYFQSKLIDPPKHLVVQISNGSPRWGAQPEAEMPDLFPPREIVHAGLSAEEFSRFYFQHLESVGIEEIKSQVAEVESLARASKREAVLCCFESLKKPEQYCHRTMFAAWYRQKTGIEIGELGQTQPALAL